MSAFAVGGLVALIPAFVDRSAPRMEAASYAWLQRLPPPPEGISPLPEPSTQIGSAPDGQKLLASRIGPGELCMRFGNSGRACESLDTSKHIQPVARVRTGDGDVLWVLFSDDVAAIRISHEQGGSTSRFVQRGFGVLEPRGKAAVAIEAHDADGRALGRIAGDAFVPTMCDTSTCLTVDTS